LKVKTSGGDVNKMFDLKLKNVTLERGRALGKRIWNQILTWHKVLNLEIPSALFEVCE
jgi:hypothetical protein